MTKATSIFLMLSVAAVVLAQPVSAAVLTSVLEDPAGDAFIAGGLGRPGEPFQDIISAKASLRDGRFEFRMQFAGTIPESPALPTGITLFEWRWGINTDPATNPKGFPFAPGSAAGGEFQVQIIWDGAFAVRVIDRRPLLQGLGAELIPVPFRIMGSEFRVVVDADILDNPLGFGWAAFTVDWPTPLGTDSFLGVDFAGPGIWPLPP